MMETEGGRAAQCGTATPWTRRTCPTHAHFANSCGPEEFSTKCAGSMFVKNYTLEVRVKHRTKTMDEERSGIGPARTNPKSSYSPFWLKCWHQCSSSSERCVRGRFRPSFGRPAIFSRTSGPSLPPAGPSTDLPQSWPPQTSSPIRRRSS